MLYSGEIRLNSCIKIINVIYCNTNFKVVG